MRIYLRGTIVITADEITGNITNTYQRGSVKPEAIYDVTNTMVGLRVFYQEVNRFLNIPIYNVSDPNNRISDEAGVPYANAQAAFNALCDIVGFNSDGSGGVVTSVNGQTGSVTVNLNSALSQGNDSPIRALFNGVPYLTENEIPVFLTETSVFADIQPNRLHIYIGIAPLLFDLDVIIAQPPAPNPPQQNFSVTNNSGFNFGIISGGGASGFVVNPRYSYVTDITITDQGSGYWDIALSSLIPYPTAQQVFSANNVVENITAIFQDNLGNQQNAIYQDGMFARDFPADREVWYNSRFVRVAKQTGLKTWFLNYPDISSNPNLSGFSVNFRPNVSGTVAYLSDITNLNLPVLIDETFTISEFQTGVTYYYVGNANVTYDYDTQPYPLPVPVSNFNYVNLSVYDVTFLSNTGNNGFVLTPNQRLLGIFFNDNGAAWEINAVEYFDNVYNLQQVSNKGNETSQALIVRNNPNNYRTIYSVIGQQIQYDVGGVRVEYTYDKIQVNQNSTLANFTINLPNISGNTPASNTVVNFRPTVSGTVAYLSDIPTLVVYTSSNGITKTGNDFALGGALTQNTSVTGAFILTFEGSTTNLGINSGTVNIGTGGGAKIINIGGTSDTVNIYGTVNNQNVTNLNVTDKLVTYNKGGAVSSGFDSGFEIEENGVIVGYVKSDGTRVGFLLKSPASFEAFLNFANLTANRTYTFQNKNYTIAGLDDIAEFATQNESNLGLNATKAISPATANINNRVTENTLDRVNDFVEFWDASASIARKTSLGDLINIKVRSTITVLGTTAAVDLSLNTRFLLDLRTSTGNVTVTFSNPIADMSFQLDIIDHAATARTLTFSGGTIAGIENEGNTYVADFPNTRYKLPFDYYSNDPISGSNRYEFSVIPNIG